MVEGYLCYIQVTEIMDTAHNLKTMSFKDWFDGLCHNPIISEKKKSHEWEQAHKAKGKLEGSQCYILFYM